jgi:hypothetical protein
MNPREQRVMGVILAIAALYIFEWNTLYIFGIAGIIYLILRNRR